MNAKTPRRQGRGRMGRVRVQQSCIYGCGRTSDAKLRRHPYHGPAYRTVALVPSSRLPRRLGVQCSFPAAITHVAHWAVCGALPSFEKRLNSRPGHAPRTNVVIQNGTNKTTLAPATYAIALQSGRRVATLPGSIFADLRMDYATRLLLHGQEDPHRQPEDPPRQGQVPRRRGPGMPGGLFRIGPR